MFLRIIRLPTILTSTKSLVFSLGGSSRSIFLMMFWCFSQWRLEPRFLNGPMKYSVTASLKYFTCMSTNLPTKASSWALSFDSQALRLLSMWKATAWILSSRTRRYSFNIHSTCSSWVSQIPRMKLETALAPLPSERTSLAWSLSRSLNSSTTSAAQGRTTGLSFSCSSRCRRSSGVYPDSSLMGINQGALPTATSTTGQQELVSMDWEDNLGLELFGEDPLENFSQADPAPSRKPSADLFVEDSFYQRPDFTSLFQGHKVLGGLSGFVHMGEQNSFISNIQPEAFQKIKDLRLDRFFGMEQETKHELNDLFDKLEDSSFDLLKAWEGRLPPYLNRSCVENVIYTHKHGHYPGFNNILLSSFENLLKSLEGCEKGENEGQFIISSLLKFSLGMLRKMYCEIIRFTNRFTAQTFRKKIDKKEDASKSSDSHPAMSIEDKGPKKKYAVSLDQMILNALTHFPDGARKNDVLERIESIYQLSNGGDQRWKRSVEVMLASSPKVERTKGVYYYLPFSLTKGDRNSATVKGRVLLAMIELGQPSSLKTIIGKYSQLFQQHCREQNLEASLKKVINRYQIFDKSKAGTLYKLAHV